MDELTSATGYHRKHAIRVLKNKVQLQNHFKGKTKTYKSLYRGEVVQALEQIWEIYGQICSKRLQPFLPEAIRVLEGSKEINLSNDTKELLLKISSASIDRCLCPIRRKSPHGLSTTKPGSLLKKVNCDTHLYSLGRRTTGVPGNRPGRTLWKHDRRAIPEHFDLY